MRAEILTIGDEILIGQIVNTNSVWMAQQLNLIGVKVAHMSTIADDEKDILNAFAEASSRADFVLITGGLGPTRDDITKTALAKFFNVPLVRDEKTFREIEEYFSKRGRQLNGINADQALILEGCSVLQNKQGTAPGLWMKYKNTVFVAMPGVPYEMKAIMTESVLPRIKKENELPYIYHHTLLTQGIGESEIAEMISAWEDTLPAKNIKLAYLPQPGMVRLRLSASGPNETELKQLVDTELKVVHEKLARFVFGLENYAAENVSLEKVVSGLLRERKKTISLAESCTGGYISSLITALPGASEVFKGAIVPYTNKAKHELLQVDEALFTTVGAVSEECVLQLAEHVKKVFHSDYAISVSGIAGPTGATAEKPVGTVWIAVAGKEKIVSKKFQFGDNRNRNIISSASAALNMVRKMILEDAPN